MVEFLVVFFVHLDILNIYNIRMYLFEVCNHEISINYMILTFCLPTLKTPVHAMIVQLKICDCHFFRKTRRILYIHGRY